jgi:alpha-mannosidase
MKISEIAVLLPCHSLEDFPVYHEGSAADELLSAWCAAWHPLLIAATGALPNWQRVDLPPETLTGLMIFIPPFCIDRLPAGFVQRVENEGGWLVAEATADAATQKALAGLDESHPIDSQLAEDFRALGFCRLQIELLTRQMRYSVNIDETHFQTQAVAAAEAAVAGDTAKSREHLQQCFDTLYDARKHFYPVDVYLLDITLLAPTTLGAALEADLAPGNSINLLGNSALLQQMATEHPNTWQALLREINYGRACVLGGDDEESQLPLLPLEKALNHLRGGALQYEALLGSPPVVYGRRRAGLWPVLPQLLAKLGYQGVLHFTLDDGKFPLGPQCKTRWEGVETSVIDILARVPADAARPETFLAFSRTMADSMDTDHVATVAYAHWPGATSVWYGVLRRIAQLSPVLGKFLLLDEYFMHTDMPGRLSKFSADDYQTPYLKQAIIRRQPDPISSIAKAHAEQAVKTQSQALVTLCELLGKPLAASNEPNALEQVSQLLPRTSEAATPRCLVFNSELSARRLNVELPAFPAALGASGPVVAAASSGSRHFAIVDVPSLGFAWIEPGEQAAPSPKEKGIVSEHTLSNEFLEVRISSKTGGIQGLYNYSQRGNQLSQQVAVRSSGSGAAAAYTTARVDSIEVTANSSIYGEIVTRGGLLDESGRQLASFRQTFGLWAGSRIVNVDIELADLEELRADPWNSYCCARFAWPDEQAELYRGVSLARVKTTVNRLEAPEFIEIDSGGGRVAILTGGLPYHRRSDSRMLDSILVVRGETANRFKLGIGVDLPQPAAAAVELLRPTLVHCDTSSPAKNATGWFFHTGAKNLIATHWEPLYAKPATESQAETSTDSGVRVAIGFRVRLLEIGGTAGRVPLRAFKPLRYARQVDFMGETILELYVDDDKIMLDFGPNELVEIEAHWTA